MPQLNLEGQSESNERGERVVLRGVGGRGHCKKNRVCKNERSMFKKYKPFNVLDLFQGARDRKFGEMKLDREAGA